jgi:hypothetical protein
MTRRAAAAVAGFLTAGVPVVVAQGAPEAQFLHERAVSITIAGPQRLGVDVALLAGTQPFTVSAQGERWVASGGLADLRVFTSAGLEVPYLLVPPAASAPVWITGKVLPVTPTEKTSGFEVDLGETTSVDAIGLGGIGAPFLKRFTLEGSGDRERWTRLVGEGSAFDLPAEGLRHTTIEFVAGSYRYLRVVWDDTNSARVALPSVVTARRVEPSSPGPILRAPVIAERRPSEPDRSRFRMTLPAGQLPIVALELTVGGEYLLREARVLEARLMGEQAVPQVIGRAQLQRVVRNGMAADALRILIRPPQEPQLELVVEDGDNPPLDLRGVTAVFAELPWIYFEAQPGTVIARYGDRNLPAPRYDLEAAREQIPLTAAHASWGDERALRAVEEPGGLPLPESGSALDAGAFSYTRAIPAGRAGLITVPLDAAVLAHSGSLRTRFADVRVLDRAGLQVPYLLEQRDEPITLDVRLERRDLPANLKLPPARRSSYVVHLPYQRLPSTRLTLRTRARVFQRSITLGLLLPADDRRREPRLDPLATTRWVHADPDTPAGALIVEIPERRSGELILMVDEGDNQPLPIERATLLMPSHAVRLFRRPDLPLHLVYGRDDLAPPQYDLALLAPQVLGPVAEEVYAGPEQAADRGRLAATFVSPPVFWGSLALSVIVLLVIVARLMRRDVESSSPTV